MYERTTANYRDEIAKHIKELVKLARPHLPESDLEVLARKTTEILERFGLAFAQTKTDSETDFLNSQPYITFDAEMRQLPEWFREYQAAQRRANR